MSRGFDESLQAVLAWEGGYADYAADPGGATNHGITRQTLSRWRARPGRPPPRRREGRAGGRRVSKADVRNLTREEAAEIYRAWYWEACRCDELPAPVALAVFDAAVNQGPSRARRFLQKAAGVTADGIVGPVTLGAVRGADATTLLRDLMARRALHYSALPRLATFGLGWFRRLFDIHRRALALAGDAVGTAQGA